MCVVLCVQARLEEISQLWQKLIETSSTKRQKLIDAQKRGQFVREVDEVAAWIADREAVASAEDMGKDLEHVEMLQKNFADFMKVHTYMHYTPTFSSAYILCCHMTCIIFALKDLQASESRVTEVNTQAEKLQRERHPDIELIRSRQEALNQSWKDLTTIAKYREQRLAGAHEIQKFNR